MCKTACPKEPTCTLKFCCGAVAPRAGGTPVQQRKALNPQKAHLNRFMKKLRPGEFEVAGGTGAENNPARREKHVLVVMPKKQGDLKASFEGISSVSKACRW